MKTKKLLILLFILPLSFNIALAQYPILKADSINPDIGDVFSGYEFGNVVNAGSAGNGVTWNFSSLPDSFVGTITFKNPSTTPYVASFDSDSLGADSANLA